MNIQAVKIELMRMIINTENPFVLDKAFRIIQSEKKDFWPTLSKQEQEEIYAGIEELDQNDKFNYEDIIKKHRKPRWK